MAQNSAFSKNLLSDCSFFKGLPEEDVKFLLEADAIRYYSKHAQICTEGDPANLFYIVLSGWVKIYNINSDGDVSCVQPLTHGSVFCADSIFEQGVNLYSAQAISECELMEIPLKDLVEKSATSPELSARLLSVLSQRIADMQVTLACSELKDSSQRTACLLLRLSSWMTGKGGTFKMPYEKSIAAEQLGMDQATISRALARLEDIGVSSSNGEIHIKNFSLLSKHCCPHCPIPSNRCGGRRQCSQEGVVEIKNHIF